MAELPNVVRDYGASRTRCAYCHDTARFCAHGMMTSIMTVQTCQDLVDVGWTRSGHYMYKPDLSQMCCPSYTIRLAADDFIPSKKQRKALQKLQSYLDGAALSSKHKAPPDPALPRPVQESQTDSVNILKLLLGDHVRRWCLMEGFSTVDVEVRVREPSQRQRRYLPFSVFLTSPVCFSLFHTLTASPRADFKWRSVEGMAKDFSVYFRKVKDVFYKQYFSPGQQTQWAVLMQDMEMTSLGGHLNFYMTAGKAWNSGLATEILPVLRSFHDPPLSPPSSRIETSTATSSISPEESSLPLEYCAEISRKRSLTTRWAVSSFVEEEFQLYKKYQMQIHGESEDRCSVSRYERFLVDSPLIHQAPDDGIPDPGMGSFHMQYRIDGRLIAVGVIDILPRSLCSGYFFWDPDFASLSLGKISAMAEIEWVKKARHKCPSLQYYFIGYYVHSCSKTQYKADYEPSELLCPESCVWVKLTAEIRHRLWEEPYLVLSTIPEVECKENHVLASSEKQPPSPIDSQQILVFDECMTLGECMERLSTERENGVWSERQMWKLKWLMPYVTVAMGEWRKKAMRVAEQLIYSCADFITEGENL